MHRMRDNLTTVGLFLLTLAILLAFPATTTRGALLKPNAGQAFPDMASDIVGSQNYTYNAATQTGTFVVNNSPALIALGTQASNEYYVYDPAGQPRSETIQVKLDASGNIVSDPGNSFSVYGSVTIGGKNFSGLLLQGTPTGFGFAATNPGTPTMSNFDLDISLTGGLLKEAYGPEAYIRVSSELGSTFDGSFTSSFSGLKTWTNVRAYDAPKPSPVPEPSTCAILLVCSGAGLYYHQRRRIDVATLIVDE